MCVTLVDAGERDRHHEQLADLRLEKRFSLLTPGKREGAKLANRHLTDRRAEARGAQPELPVERRGDGTVLPRCVEDNAGIEKELRRCHSVSSALRPLWRTPRRSPPQECCRGTMHRGAVPPG